MEIMFWVLVGCVGAFFIFKLGQRGSFKGALFNATIKGSSQEIGGSGTGLLKSKVKVHSMERNGQQLVGLELIASGFGSYEMMPFTLSISEARELIYVLEQTIQKTNPEKGDTTLIGAD